MIEPFSLEFQTYIRHFSIKSLKPLEPFVYFNSTGLLEDCQLARGVVYPVAVSMLMVLVASSQSTPKLMYEPISLSLK